jgi:nucleotide-binding universal stress UspA family protein
MYGRVVVPLDGSELAEEVLPHVTEVVRGRDSRVYLLSVSPLLRGLAPIVVDVDAPVTDSSQSGESTQEERRRIERELGGYLRGMAKRLEPVVADVRAVVRFGRPAEEILAFASDVDADLIAMSTHGRSGISRWVFGSVVERVLRGAACPVLLVRAGQALLRTTYQRILVPLDGSEMAEQVVPYVKALVRPSRASLSGETFAEDTRVFLISVLTTYPPGLQLATTVLHQTDVQLRAYLRSVAAVLREQGAVVQIAIEQGTPADKILTYAAEVGADLIAMTTHGASGPSRWVYGNVAGKVLQGACSPVLLVRPASELGGNRI